MSALSDHLRLALFEPDIAQNTGAMMRLAACLGIGLDLIEPCGFVLDDRRLRRAGMDYMDSLDLRRHISWRHFHAGLGTRRLVLLTTQASTSYLDLAFRPDDVLLVGRESGGVGEEVHAAAHERVLIPMRPGLRSLNVALAAAMVLGEAVRQTRPVPDTRPEAE